VVGLDTNVMIRWLTLDPAASEQSQIASAAILARTAEGVFVNSVVLAELAWVLERSLRFDRVGIAAVIESVLAVPSITVADRPQVEVSLKNFQAGKAGFADCLIAALNASGGCTTTLTFDKSATKSPHFTLLT